MDIDHDSDQSEDLFGDDENYSSARGSSIQPPEIDAYFKSPPSTQPYGFSPYKSAVAAPECPSTPCSLGPFLTKAPTWTADLETPEANKASRLLPEESPRAVNRENISSNPLKLTPTDFNLEDVIPVSPVIPRKKKKRLSRRILSNISNRETPESPNNSSLLYLSPIAEKSIEGRLDDSSRSLSSTPSSYPSSSTSGIRSSESLSPVERVRRLKELQASKISHFDAAAIAKIPDDEFFRDYLALETSKYHCQPPRQDKLEKSPSKDGFVAFSQLSRDEIEDLPEESFHYDPEVPFSQFSKNKQPPETSDLKFGAEESTESDELIANLKTSSGSPDFKGFSLVSRQQSQEVLIKHKNLLCEEDHRRILDSEENFKGFETHIIYSSKENAEKHRRFYENYLDGVFPVGKIIKRKDSDKIMDLENDYFRASVLRTTVCSTIKTASKKEILVSVKNVVRQELLLLGDENEKHEIDLLVENRMESTPVKDSGRCRTEDSKNSGADDFESLEFNVDLEEAVSKVEFSGLENSGGSSRDEQNKSFNCKLNLGAVSRNSDANNRIRDVFKRPVIKKFPAKISTNVSLDKNIVEDLEFEELGAVGFKTGRGKSIKIPDNAMVEAKNLMSDDELNKINLDKIKKDKVSGAGRFSEPVASTSGLKRPRGEDSRIEKRGFGGRNIFTSKSKSNKRESEEGIFEDLEDLPANPAIVGFTTGAGKSIKVAESALARAQVAFAKDLENEDPEGEIIALKNRKEKSEKNFGTPAINSVTFGFQTGGGKNIKVAESAISRAQADFAKDLEDEDPESEIIAFKNKNKKVLFENKNSGGSTFAKDLETEDPESEIIALKNRKENSGKNFGGPAINSVTFGFQTGGGKNIKVAENAISRVQADFAKDLEDENPTSKILEFKQKKLNQRFSFPGSSSSKTFSSGPGSGSSGGLMIKNSAFLTNARKRKSEDETPAGRKRLCVGLDLQKRKLFNDIEEEDESLLESGMMLEGGPVSSDRNLGGTPLQAQRIDASLISSKIINDEVRASIDALLNENIDFEAEDTWTEINNVNKQTWSAGPGEFPRNSEHPKPEKRSKSFPGSVPKSPKHDSIPEDLYFETQFSQEMNCSLEDVSEERKIATLEQEKIIEGKKRTKEKPIAGSWLKSKRLPKISLAQLAGNRAPEYFSPEDMESKDFDPEISTITSASASSYRFTGAYFRDLRSKASVPVGDGAVLIPDEENRAGVEEFSRSFLASPGVDPSLVPAGWLQNHYRWIVWKLASMDRLRFDGNNCGIGGKFLTPETVMKQLKYRYDREIDRSERPALRRILEKDDPASRRLVLCVSRVLKDTIELTDGWYSVPASLDPAITSYLASGKLREGTKLMIQGAELLNLEEGRSPLEITKEVRLKIHTNSTRRARWDAKLGFQRSCGPLAVPLGSVKSNGGAIGKLVVAVSRVYPILYREKTSDGQSIVRNARCEEKAALAFEAECQKRIEAICSSARSFGESPGSAGEFELETRVRNNLPNRRNVTPILKAKVADGGWSALLTIWSCDEELLGWLKEETCVGIRNVTAGGRRANELQITAGKSSLFERIPGRISCSPRVFTSIQEAAQRGFNPVYGEFDTVGIVVSTGPAPHGMKNYETVNLAFKSLDDQDSSSYLSILFWESVAASGFAGIATVGSIIACLNLEWRKSTYLSIPTAFCSERTLLTRNPRHSHLRHAFDSLAAKIRDPICYAAECAQEIQREVDKKSNRSTPNSDRRWSNSWTPEREAGLVNPDSVERNDLRKSAILNSRDKARWHQAHESSILHLENSPKVNSSFALDVKRLRKE